MRRKTAHAEKPTRMAHERPTIEKMAVAENPKQAPVGATLEQAPVARKLKQGEGAGNGMIELMREAALNAQSNPRIKRG